MAESNTSNLKAGFTRLRQNPQLWWTIFVAGIIFVAFIVIANLFVTIAQDAQDRLINVRVGSIQDTLVEYVNEVSDEDLGIIVKSIAKQNDTIKEFRVISLLGDESTVIASISENETGQVIQDSNQLLSFALSDVNNSYTTEILDGGERYYITVRAFQNRIGETVGYIETRQTLSEADRIINDNIKKSILIFILIVIFVMLLFLRHAKIVDYVSLYKKLKEVDNLKDDFISMASHELKSPLAVIRGYAEFLYEAREIKDQNKEYARRIDVSSKQLATLIEDMLDVSRIEQERMKFEYTNFKLISFLKEQFQEFEMLASDKGLNLSFETTEESETNIKLDQNKLRQIFVNILSNSIKYTEKGSVNVKVNIIKDKSVEIRFSDTGIGMTEEELNNLFGKFYRVKNKETEEVSGTGLGLWITKQLVEKMGGKISVESIKGKGTDFVVIFPIK